ncbi:hypothetical protein EV424DRAFT_1349695 [Suillus variegatus]|nr:hypothetical protein EV424DRAFT_1349695 [Suillus variegatus]
MPSHSLSRCAYNWKAANTITENTTKVFDQTGVFVSVCRHGIVQTLVEMRRSGELAKYALATANKLMDVYGPNNVTGYDIGCSFSKTAAASSIANKYHTFYQEGLGIEDLETCRFLYNNYKQALDIINNVTPAIEELKVQLDLTDADFRRWNVEELEYLESLANEVEYDPQQMAYVEALQSLKVAEAEYGGITSVEFLSYVPANFTQNGGLHKGSQVSTRAREVERRAAYSKLLLEMNAVLDLERRIGVMQHWTLADPEYQEALKYLHNHQFIHAVWGTLQFLVEVWGHPLEVAFHP